MLLKYMTTHVLFFIRDGHRLIKAFSVQGSCTGWPLNQIPELKTMPKLRRFHPLLGGIGQCTQWHRCHPKALMPLLGGIRYHFDTFMLPRSDARAQVHWGQCLTPSRSGGNTWWGLNSQTLNQKNWGLFKKGAAHNPEPAKVQSRIWFGFELGSLLIPIFHNY